MIGYIMKTMHAIMSPDKCILAAYDSLQEAEDALKLSNNSLPLPLDDLYSIEEIKINQTPRDAESDLLEARIEQLYYKKGVLRLKINKGISFYEQTYNERLKMVIDILETDHKAETLNEDILKTKKIRFDADFE